MTFYRITYNNHDNCPFSIQRIGSACDYNGLNNQINQNKTTVQFEPGISRKENASSYLKEYYEIVDEAHPLSG